MSFLGRASYKTLRNAYGVGNPTVGSTAYSVLIDCTLESLLEEEVRPTVVLTTLTVSLG